MLIKKDKNEELEKILAQKKIEEQAKNLLQGILYKIEVSYKDYKKVKGKKQTEEKFVGEILGRIEIVTLDEIEKVIKKYGGEECYDDDWLFPDHDKSRRGGRYGSDNLNDN